MSRRKENKTPVVKASGEIEPYSVDKLRRSLERSGASARLVDIVARAVDEHIHPGITTRELYRLAHEELRRAERPAAARYSLRRAVMALGPSGYPFERLVGAVFDAWGYTTELNRTLAGRCISHEVDVVARRDDAQTLVECKFHSQPGYRTDVKVALYVNARAVDLADDPHNRVAEFWLVTNTKFSADALVYGRCAGLRLLGWDTPEDAGLQHHLESEGILPITCLSTLNNTARKGLLERGIVTLGDLGGERDLLDELGVRGSEADRVFEEARRLDALAAR